MEIQELVLETKSPEGCMTLEETSGVFSGDGWFALLAGKLEECNAYDEARKEFSRWKDFYETWPRRKQSYTEKMQEQEWTAAMRSPPTC